MRKVEGWTLAVLGGLLIAVGSYVGIRAMIVARAYGEIVIALVPVAGAVAAVLVGAGLLSLGKRLRGASPEPAPYAR